MEVNKQLWRRLRIKKYLESGAQFTVHGRVDGCSVAVCTRVRPPAVARGAFRAATQGGKVAAAAHALVESDGGCDLRAGRVVARYAQPWRGAGRGSA